MSPSRYRLALCGLAVVLLTLTGFAVGSAIRTDRAASRVTASALLADAYDTARYAVAEEESLERKYRLEPGPEVREKFGTASGDLVASLARVARRGNAQDRALAGRLVVVHREYLRSIGRMFAAVDRGDTAAVLAIDNGEVDPRFAAIEREVFASADGHRGDAAADIADLGATERSVLTITPLIFAAGFVLLVFLTVVLARVNRLLRRQADASEHAALHDALTGLANRVLFGEHLQAALHGAPPGSELFSVLMLDLNRFKEINDTLGHSVGDRVLTEVGRRLSRLLGPQERLARLSGDEFALLLPASGPERAGVMATRILAAIREPLTLDELTISVDASIGIVTYPLHATDAETLLQRADVAMYIAKAQCRDQAVYDAAQDPYDAGRLLLVDELRTAIEDGQIVLHYQPKFRAGDLVPIGVEALARWQHPVRGLLPPSEFIDVAENTGLIRPLTLEVLRSAARQWHAWAHEGIDVTFAVNLSVVNLLDAHLHEDVQRILAEEQMPASRLVLEITEGTFMSDPRRMTMLLEHFSGMGIQLSIDDYGTGYSSLAYLRRLPVQELKIDRAFVGDLAQSDQDVRIVRSTIELGHSLGLRVVAEGVEDSASLAILQGQGCDLIQGFHLGRPEPAETLVARLRGAAPAPTAPPLPVAEVTA